MLRAFALAVATLTACGGSSREGIEQRSRAFEELGRQRLAGGELDAALVYFDHAYQLGDRPSLRLLLGRALGTPPATLDVGFADSVIVDVAFSPDGAWLAIAGDAPDGKHGVFLWSTQTGKLEKTLPATTAVTAFAWKPDATQILVASSDGARFYDVVGGRSSAIEGVRGRIERIAWGARARALVVDGAAIALTDLTPPRESIPLAQRPLAISAERALVCSETCELAGATLRVPIVIAAERAAMTDQLVAIASATAVELFDTAGKPLTSMPVAHAQLAFTPDGTLLVTWTAQTIQIWDVAGHLLAALPSNEPVERVTPSRDASQLAISPRDRIQGRIQIDTLAVERRAPAAVHADVRCRVPLELVDGRLVVTPVVCTK